MNIEPSNVAARRVHAGTAAAKSSASSGLRFDTRRQIVRSLASPAALSPRLTEYVR